MESGREFDSVALADTDFALTHLAGAAV